MNIDKSYIYDERPGFESYNMMNFPYPGMPIYPNMNYVDNNLESKISKLENKIDNLQNRVSRLENNMYPQAIDSNTFPKATYQNSLNIM